MAPLRNMSRYFFEMLLHCMCIDCGKDEGNSLVFCRAYGAKNISIFKLLLPSCSRSCPFFRPYTSDRSPLTNTRLILKPDINIIWIYSLRNNF